MQRTSHGPGGVAEQGGKRIRSALGVGSAKGSKYAVLPENEQGYALPAKPTVCDYAMHPFRGFRQFAQLLLANFGGKFVGMIVCNYLGVKGLLLSIMGLVRLSYCKKTLGVDGTQCQTIGAIASTPWAIKGALGVISDSYPLMGYHKASYIICTAVMGTLAYFCLAALPVGSPMTAAVLLFLANLQIATADLLCEGKYASLMQAKPKTGSAMVSLVWGCFQLGALIAACVVGPVADSFNPQVLFWVCIPLAAQIIYPTSRNWLADEKVPDDRRGLNWALLQQHPYIVGYCLLMALCALGNGLIDTLFFEDHGIQMAYALTCAIGLSILAFCWLPRMLAQCNFYMFLSSMLYVNVGGAQDFWFTADEACVPGGPAFDYTYYNTYTWVVGAITGWLGIVIFQSTMSGWTFRNLFWVTTIFQVVASGFDLLIINRVNVRLGISDKVFYMLGDAVIGPAIGMFSAMPALVLTSKLVPKGLESTVYALLAGFQNFGGVVSSQIGIFATQASGIKTTAPCDFTNLSWLVAIAHCFLPLLAVPLTFVLIPNKLMTDKVIEEGAHDTTDDGGEEEETDECGMWEGPIDEEDDIAVTSPGAVQQGLKSL
eukprot:Tamp_10071.p1 GENE.Tamp_10071~~Tamp_10071.p1  ORF type:complete len:642 (+),score=101.05 Tamp_10071:129-1928(+)